jgi:hypothetical protein
VFERGTAEAMEGAADVGIRPMRDEIRPVIEQGMAG